MLSWFLSSDKRLSVFQRRAAGNTVIDSVKNMLNCWSRLSNAANCRCYQGSTIGLEDRLHWQVSRLWKWWAVLCEAWRVFHKITTKAWPAWWHMLERQRLSAHGRHSTFELYKSVLEVENETWKVWKRSWTVAWIVRHSHKIPTVSSFFSRPP